MITLKKLSYDLVTVTKSREDMYWNLRKRTKNTTIKPSREFVLTKGTMFTLIRNELNPRHPKNQDSQDHIESLKIIQMLTVQLESATKMYLFIKTDCIWRIQ